MLFLIGKPATGWERITENQRSLGFVCLGYFFPLLLIAAIGEGLGMTEWRTLSTGTYGVIHFNPSRIVVFETMHMAVTLAVVATCAYFVWLLREPFHGHYDFVEALMLMMCSLIPLILCQMLNGIPKISLWVSWGAGIYFSLRIFYHGLRCLSKAHPRNLDGLFFLSSAVIISLTGAQRYILIQCLNGHAASLNSMIVSMAAKLPF